MGIETWPKGDSYEGAYKDNKFHGIGILITHGGTYKGHFFVFLDIIFLQNIFI